MSNLTNDDLFIEQLNQVERELKVKLKKLNNIAIKVQKISKNDSIKDRVTSILNTLRQEQEQEQEQQQDEDEQNTIILLGGYSNNIPKLISIVEIVKQNNESSKLFQFNKLSKFESENNPNYKPKKEENNDDGKVLTEEEIQKKLEEEARKEIHGAKVYSLPTMFIILSNQDLSQIDLTNWTSQS
ncbi:unnamed protein product [Candida verbasci]|uniref:DNA/RNA-binding protein Alba-like domain-containing protein n=1 Tax=Candida verbasci TaxID=1227364 RepID=A0A9W4XNL3_9ASCO|nr:unnamed protein product [Candida verbasci]